MFDLGHVRSFVAVANGFAQMSRGGGAGRGYPTDLRGFLSEAELAGDEAARAMRILARAAVEQPPVGPDPAAVREQPEVHG